MTAHLFSLLDERRRDYSRCDWPAMRPPTSLLVSCCRGHDDVSRDGRCRKQALGVRSDGHREP